MLILNLALSSRKWNFISSRKNIPPQRSVASYAKVVLFVRDFFNLKKNMHHTCTGFLFKYYWFKESTSTLPTCRFHMLSYAFLKSQFQNIYLKIIPLYNKCEQIT